jgi:hypothetical protein
LNYDVFQFVFGDGSDPGTVLDVIDIGSIAAGTTFTLPSIFDPASTQVFSCNNQLDPTSGGSQSLFDSGGLPMAGPCTPGVTAALAISQNGVSFTTGSGFNSFNLVLDAPAVATTPEPASLFLFGTGFALLGARARRRFRRA